MKEILTHTVISLFTLIIGVFGAMSLFSKNKLINLEKKQKDAKLIIEQSEVEAQNIKEETKILEKRSTERLDEEVEKREERISKIKASLVIKEESIEKKEKKQNEIKFKIASINEEIQSLKNSINKIEKQTIDKLCEKNNTTVEKLKESMLKELEIDLEEGNKRKKAEIEEDLKENATKKAKNILISTIQRISSPTSVETREVQIVVPKDFIKGKIVGKDAKNIMELEKRLDVAIVFNDMPNIISVSAFNLVQRKIAETVIKKLINYKGEIDEKVVEKVIIEANEETEKELYKIGKNALEKMGLKNANEEFIRTIGRLQYRTSYGQNIMKHSMEVAWIATLLGSELNLSVETCREAGFLHDLGKAIDQDPNIKDAHDQLTKDLMEKYGFSKEAIHAAWAHHDAEKQQTPEALIVKAADAVSGGRPGARQDSLDRYIERMQGIDKAVNSFEGVKKSFAMSAGREIRVYVDPEKILDTDIEKMAKSIANKVEQDVVYPGKIKIKVIRRTKCMDIAK